MLLRRFTTRAGILSQALSIGEDGRAAATPPQSFGMKVLNGCAVWHWAARPFAGPGG